MYTDIPLLLSLVFIVGGLAALAWSSDFFVDGAAKIARVLGVSPFIIGMVIIGFGTSAPELCVSVMSGLSNHSNLSLGNAYGSCAFNIAMILGVAVLIFPLVVRPSVTFVAGPGLALITGFSYLILRDGTCSRADGFLLLAAFAVLLPLYCWFDQKSSPKGVSEENIAEGREATGGREISVAIFKLVVGLAVLIGSSHLLCWGAVDLAHLIAAAAGVESSRADLIIGLTVVAAGTSLPELASAVQSARRGEHEFVLGNIIGSNLFNTLAVVGLATSIAPTSDFSPYILIRDLPLLAFLSLTIFLFGINWRHPLRPGAIRRNDAVLWIVIFVLYTGLMIWQETH